MNLVRPVSSTCLLLVTRSQALAQTVLALLQAQGEGEGKVSTFVIDGDLNAQRAEEAGRLQALFKESETAGSDTVMIADCAATFAFLREAVAAYHENSAHRLVLTHGPFLEGAFAALRASAAGLSTGLIAAAATNALLEKSLVEEEDDADESKAEATGQAVIEDDLGLHPGPAAQIALVAAAFDAEISIFDVTAGRGPASARSLTELGGLQAHAGHCLRIDASGPDAARAVSALANLISSFHLKKEQARASSLPAEITKSRAAAMSPGIAYGPIIVLSRALPAIPVNLVEDKEGEVDRLLAAIAEVRHDLATRASDQTLADILALQDVFLQDPALVDAAIELIRREGRNAADAFARMGAAAMEVYTRFEDETLRARAADLRDAIDAVLGQLLSIGDINLPDGEPAILLTSDLPPSLAQKLDPARILGVIDRRGAPTSHAAVLLREAGLPAVCGAEVLMPAHFPASAILDGASGELVFDPDPLTVRQIQSRYPATLHASPAEPSHGFATTRDGVVAELFVNISNAAEAKAALQAGALGVGLLRSEMPFLDRVDMPSENEQYHVFRPIFERFAGRTVIARNFDAAEDKPLPFMTRVEAPAERVSIVETQMAALLRAGMGTDLRLLLPKIADVEEVIAARLSLTRVHERLTIAGIAHVWPVPLGMMIEIPAAALTAKSFSPHVDFFSLGTNDLAQFTDGIARASARSLAPSPGLLRLVHMVVEAAAAAGKPLSVCGEMAAEPPSALLLFGLGVRSFSMRALAFNAVSKALAAHGEADLRALAANAMAAASAAAVAKLAQEFLAKSPS